METNDFGPVYKESNFSNIIVEPWAVISNLGFLVIALYWFFKIRYDKKNSFLLFLLPFLLIGFIGGTMFHATRSNQIWLFMDFLPIIFIFISIMIYFWNKSGLKWWQILMIIMIPFFIMPILNLVGVSRGGPSMGYSMMGIFLILPIFYYIFKINKKHWQLAVLAFISALIAIFFRSIDLLVPFSMGTHFLWHLFGAFGTHLMFLYIYRINNHNS
jgi:hypothetical protein